MQPTKSIQSYYCKLLGKMWVWVCMIYSEWYIQYMQYKVCTNIVKIYIFHGLQLFFHQNAAPEPLSGTVSRQDVIHFWLQVSIPVPLGKRSTMVDAWRDCLWKACDIMTPQGKSTREMKMNGATIYIALLNIIYFKPVEATLVLCF